MTLTGFTISFLWCIFSTGNTRQYSQSAAQAGSVPPYRIHINNLVDQCCKPLKWTITLVQNWPVILDSFCFVKLKVSQKTLCCICKINNRKPPCWTFLLDFFFFLFESAPSRQTQECLLFKDQKCPVLLVLDLQSVQHFQFLWFQLPWCSVELIRD